jgi:hypothetical protein
VSAVGWLCYRLVNALISICGATLLAMFAFLLVANTSVAVFDQEYPHDGQNGLAAFVLGFEAFIFVEIIGSIFLYFLQRKFIRNRTNPRNPF